MEKLTTEQYVRLEVLKLSAGHKMDLLNDAVKMEIYVLHGCEAFTKEREQAIGNLVNLRKGIHKLLDASEAAAPESVFKTLANLKLDVRTALIQSESALP